MRELKIYYLKYKKFATSLIKKDTILNTKPINNLYISLTMPLIYVLKLTMILLSIKMKQILLF